MNGSVLALLVDGAVAIAIIAGGVVLAALGKIDGETTIAVFGIGVTLITGAGKATLALYTPAPQHVDQPPAVP